MREKIDKITFATIAYNEGDSLQDLLNDLTRQTYPHDLIEVLLIDSNSTDNTRQIMEQFASQNHDFWRVMVLTNPGQFLPHGWNVALRAASGDAIVRVDSHASIRPDFIEKNVAVLNEGHDVCGGLRPTQENSVTPWGKALLALENSLFGSSIAAYRRAPQPGPVSSLFHGCYRMDVFRTVGLFDERLLRTEDNDMSFRIRLAGYEIWFDPRIQSKQKIRATFKKMLKQKFGNGFWIGRTLSVQPGCVSLYHLAPLAFIVAIAACLLIALIGKCTVPLILLAGVYALFAIVMSIVAWITERFSVSYLFVMPFLFFLLHAAYGVGTLKGLVLNLTRPLPGDRPGQFHRHSA